MTLLDSYQPGGPDAGLLRERLEENHGWDAPILNGALREYRRFLFLAVTCPHPVTPSKMVDQLWHEHLLFTREYREGLCGAVLGRFLDHTPGGPSQSKQHQRQYLATLDAYHAAFGERAPEFYWPDPRLAPRTGPRGLAASLLFSGLGMGLLTSASLILDWGTLPALVTGVVGVALTAGGLIEHTLSQPEYRPPTGRPQQQTGAGRGSSITDGMVIAATGGDSDGGGSCGSGCGSGCGD